MRYAGGVDVGSTQTKAVVIDEARRIVGRALIMTGANVVTAAQEAFQAALDDGVVREYNVTRCSYAEFFKALGEPELGRFLLCDLDHDVAEVTVPVF